MGPNIVKIWKMDGNYAYGVGSVIGGKKITHIRHVHQMDLYQLYAVDQLVLEIRSNGICVEYET